MAGEPAKWPPARPHGWRRRPNDWRRKIRQYTASAVFGGGQQVTTMLSVPIAKAPLMPPTATTLSAHYVEHDSKSTHMEDRSAKRPALRSMEPWHWHAHCLSAIADMASKSETCFL